ncbi:hypothetical protein FV218_08315 [Methylobacterium sp. WL69]|uniref:hypothetical protein n=1 Tax=Methylobacterium sp. WL69 TaxID=2603893 RepID=UPI0011CC0429|nr:hypothetical protein [Methylobacterium sp. WL69]TXM75542.1 hypothetical protein FV218_08315 [Methylobacterium sp. WL69]
MLRPALALLLLTTVASRADECDGLAAQVASAIGGKAGRRQGPGVEIRVPGGIRIDLTCRAEPIVQAASGDPTPSAAYFQDLAVAGQIVVGVSADAVQAALATAHATAFREGKKSFIQQNGWSASCYTDRTGSIRTLCSVGRIPPG